MTTGKARWVQSTHTRFFFALFPALAAGVVYVVFAAQQYFRYRDDSIAVGEQGFYYAGERFGRVLRGVMEKDDAAGLNLREHALLYLGGGNALPVETVHVPLHRRHAHAVHGVYHMVVIFSVGAAEERGRDAGQLGDLLVAGGYVGNDVAVAQLREVRVRRGMVHYLVAVFGERADGFRVFIHPVADDKEGRVYIVFVENIYERLRVLVAPRSVKGHGDDLVVTLHAVNRQLPVRGRDTDDRRAVHRPEYEHDY